MTVPLGPFRLTARILSSPAGVVYSALDPAGRPVQVALLTRGAASDPAARDRFAAAVRSSGPEVLAADTADQGPWVIGTGNLAGLLEPVLLRDRARGPQFLHHWAGTEDPAFPTGRREGGTGEKAEYPTFTGSWNGGWSTGGAVSPAANRVLAVLAVLIVLALLILTIGLLVWLLRSQPEELPLEPSPSPTTVEPGPTSPSPGPSGNSGPPTPDPSGTRPVPTPTPGQSGPGQGSTPGPEGDPGEDNPL